MTSREERFGVLAAEVSRPLRAYVTRRVAPADVDDVLSEVNVVLWRRLDEVPADAVLPWAYAVGRRVLANHHRGDKRRLKLADRVGRVDPLRDFVHDDPDHSDVHAALATLKELDLEVVLLWAWEQLAPREIAEVTGLTPNAVSIRLTRARKRLAELLSSTGKNSAGAGHDHFDRGSDR